MNSHNNKIKSYNYKNSCKTIKIVICLSKDYKLSIDHGAANQ